MISQTYLWNYCSTLRTWLEKNYAVTLMLQAVGASVRIFSLLERSPTISSENGKILPNLNGCKQSSFCCRTF